MTAKEKMTAPIASVGADVEQSSSNKLTNQSIADLPGKGNLQATNNAENTAKSANKKNPDDLETVSMMELYDTAYPPKLPIIDGLLYNGTYLFVGSPKIGKSFFMAQIGYHVSKGIPLWGFSVRQGTVLYLALEDDYARLQKRLSQMFGMEGSENFYFATKSKSLNDGLEKQLVTFVTEHKDARLIIIDTLQKVREVGGDKFSYASDYEIVTKLKAFSDKYGICFLVVHHTRKMESSDSFDMISGTNGLLGAADDQLASQNTVHPKEDRVFSVRELMKIMTIPDEFKWVNFSLEELNALPEKNKKALLKKEEIKIRQSIGEAVPTNIFFQIAENIKNFMEQEHFTTAIINKTIENYKLEDAENLIKFIQNNPINLGNASLARIAELTNSKRENNAAYYTNKFILNEIFKELPSIEKDVITILEPSVGIGNFLPFIFKKYEETKEVNIDVVDIDGRNLEILRQKMALSERQMEYFSSAEYRKFYQIARNYQTRSLNVDATSVFFYGVLKEGCNG